MSQNFIHQEFSHSFKAFAGKFRLSYNLLTIKPPFNKTERKSGLIELLLRHKKRPVLTEDQLIEGCRKNKRKYQKRLYEQYCDAMYTVAFRMVNDTDLASDVLQEAFIQVFRDIDQFRGDASIGAWIKTIVVRSALKKLKSETWTLPLEDSTNGEPVEWPDQMLGQDLEKAILSLPAGYRSIFLLVEVEGYKHKEVAEMLGISEGTSKSQLFYAKKQLQKILKDFYRG